MSSHKRTVLVVSQVDHPARTALETILSDVASCEHIVASDLGEGLESMQVDQQNAAKASADMQERLEELLSDRKYTGASHVYLMQGESLANPSAIHSGILKALMEKALVTEQEVVAVLVPEEETDAVSSEVAEANFLDAVASHESLLKAFPNIKVFTSPMAAGAHLGAF